MLFDTVWYFFEHIAHGQWHCFTVWVHGVLRKSAEREANKRKRVESHSSVSLRLTHWPGHFPHPAGDLNCQQQLFFSGLCWPWHRYTLLTAMSQHSSVHALNQQRVLLRDLLSLVARWQPVSGCLSGFYSRANFSRPQKPQHSTIVSESHMSKPAMQNLVIWSYQ